MIARVQNTTKKIQFNGQTVEVWEGLSQGGIRFHLFVVSSPILAEQQLREKQFTEEMGDRKQPALETAALPTQIGE